MVPPGQALTVIEQLCGLKGAGTAPPTMLVLAHPDDESVGAASLMPALGLATFVYVTDGAPRDPYYYGRAGCASREAYADMRRGELLSALESTGVAPDRVEFVNCIDQEASLQLAALTRWIEILIREHWPTIIFTHPYEGGHPDHDATAFAVHAARKRILATGGPAPVVAEFTCCHGAGGDWQFGTFLPRSNRPEIVRRLAPGERALKRRLLGCHASQQDLLRNVPLETERFRLAPEYDFAVAPHEGALLYERYPWGMPAAEWRRLAHAASEQLGAAATAHELEFWR